MGSLLDLAKIKIDEMHRESDRHAQVETVRARRPRTAPSLLRRLARPTTKAA